MSKPHRVHEKRARRRAYEKRKDRERIAAGIEVPTQNRSTWKHAVLVSDRPRYRVKKSAPPKGVNPNLGAMPRPKAPPPRRADLQVKKTTEELKQAEQAFRRAGESAKRASAAMDDLKKAAERQKRKESKARTEALMAKPRDDLRAICKTLGITNYSKMTKEEMVKAIKRTPVARRDVPGARKAKQ